MRQSNPYRPGFNQPPTVLAGRETVLGDFTEALEIAALDHRTPRPLLLVGSRGVGKTVTLGEAALLAGRKLSWPTVHVEVTSDGLLPTLIRRLLETAQLLAGEAPKRTTRPRKVRLAGGSVTAAGLGVGAEVKLEDLNESLSISEQLDAALTYTLDLALERDSGVVLTIDEVHTANRSELGILGAELQRRVPQNLPLVVVMAGLPSLRTLSGTRPLPTYLERAEWHELGQLDDQDALRALTEPAELSHRPMTSEAAHALMQICGGYPYAIQVCGHYVWRASSAAEEITLDHTEQARARIQADLDQLFSGRWDDASPKEREYLAALAEVAETQTPNGGSVAAHLGVSTTRVSYLRERLIKKGTIYADTAGTLHFITPGMAEWIRGRGAGTN